MPHLLTHLIVAGVGRDHMTDTLTACKQGPHIIVGTPGRIFDLLQRGAINLCELRSVILDEADQLMSRGYADILFDLFDEATRMKRMKRMKRMRKRKKGEKGEEGREGRQEEEEEKEGKEEEEGKGEAEEEGASMTASSREKGETGKEGEGERGSEVLQVGMFSATLTADCIEFAKKVMSDRLPIINIEIKTFSGELMSQSQVKHYYLDCQLPKKEEEEEGEEACKYGCLCDLLEKLRDHKTIIFCQSQERVRLLGDRLVGEKRYRSDEISYLGASDQISASMTAFVHDLERKVMIVTDLFVRGLHLGTPEIAEIIISYDLFLDPQNYRFRFPLSRDFYLGYRHRIFILLAACEEDMKKLQEIADTYNICIDPLPNDFTTALK